MRRRQCEPQPRREQNFCKSAANVAADQKCDEALRALARLLAARQRANSSSAKYLFSGLTKCGVCGAGFVLYSREDLSCFGAHARRTCENRLSIPSQEVETRVLRALQAKLMRKDFFEEFCTEFAEEMNRLRMQQRAGLTPAKRELSKIETRRKKVLDLMLTSCRRARARKRCSA